jgi:DNA-binding NarL/FixJ family response regulator
MPCAAQRRAEAPLLGGRWYGVASRLLDPDTRTAPENVALVVLDPPDDALLRVVRALGSEIIEYRGLDAFARERASTWPAAVVLTCRRYGPSLIEAVGAARRRDSESEVVVACERLAGGEAGLLLSAGVAGVVLWGEAERTLAPTLRSVSAGQVCVPRRHALYVGRRVLSTREKQVLGLVAMGFMNSEIAARMFLAESTVKSHLSSAFEKLGVHSRHEAVELIANPAFGLGSGILSLGAEPIQPVEGEDYGP